jgi:hypothetical protein
VKIISDTTQGIPDHVTVALFALAPGVLGLTGTAALISYGWAGIHFGVTALTNMPLGLIKIIPIKLHALIEMLVGLFVCGFDETVVGCGSKLEKIRNAKLLGAQ